MSFILIIFLCLLFFSGLVILLGSIGHYSSYIETNGEIVEALKCNPCDEDDLFENSNKNVEAVVIAYKVDGKTFHLATNYKKTTTPSAISKDVKVLYNSFSPAESHIKEGTPWLGSVLVGISILGFLLIALL